MDAGVIVNLYDPPETGSSRVNSSQPPQRRSLRVEPIRHHLNYQFDFRRYPNTHVPSSPEHTYVYYYPENTPA